MEAVKRALGIFLGIVVFAVFFVLLFTSIVGASTSLQGVWLPIGLGVVVTMLLEKAPKLGFSWLRFVVGLIYSFGVLVLWIRSEPLFGMNRWFAMIRFVSELLVFTIAGLALLAAIMWARREPRDRPPILPLVAVVFFGWLVAYFSGGAGGSDPMIQSVMRWFGWSMQAAETFVIVVRKSIHFSFYALLGYFAYRLALSGSKDWRAPAGFALLLAFAHACYDETRQAMTPNRTGSPFDVMLDMAGAGSLVWLASRRSARNADVPANPAF